MSAVHNMAFIDLDGNSFASSFTRQSRSFLGSSCRKCGECMSSVSVA